MAGVLWGLAVLTRADLLLAPIFIAIVAAGWLALRHRRPREAVGFAFAFLGGAAVVILPWVIFASVKAERFVPVTSGSPSALFVGTYLPGDGTTFGMKRAWPMRPGACIPSSRTPSPSICPPLRSSTSSRRAIPTCRATRRSRSRRGAT